MIDLLLWELAPSHKCGELTNFGLRWYWVKRSSLDWNFLGKNSTETKDQSEAKDQVERNLSTADRHKDDLESHSQVAEDWWVEDFMNDLVSFSGSDNNYDSSGLR